MEEYKAYRKNGELYVDRITWPHFTMVFDPKKDGSFDGNVLDDTELNEYLQDAKNRGIDAQTSGNLIAKIMREAGDAATDFLKKCNGVSTD